MLFSLKHIIKIILIFLSIGTVLVMFYCWNNIINSEEASPQYTQNTSYNEKHIWGKPLKTLFPDITNPKYVTAETASFFLQPGDDVYYLQSKNNIYVFPVFILGYHHIVNDIIDGQPIAITTCLLTNTPVTYKRTVSGKVLHFGVLGNLYHGNLIMYDKETDSTWIQLTGESVSGKYKDIRLDISYPIVQTKWENLRNKENLLILQPQLELDFYHSFVKKYEGRTTGLSLLQNVKLRTDLESYTNGIGIVVRNKEVFYPIDQIRKRQVINDAINGWHVVIFYNKDDETIHIYRRYINNKLPTFTLENNILQDQETHSVWSFEGEAKSGKLKGISLKNLSYQMAYWYSWSSFYPNTTIWK